MCQLFSSFLIDEDKGIMLGVVDVKLDPIFSRVTWIFLVTAADQDVGGSGNVFKEGRGASVLHGKVDVFFNFVSEG